MAIYKSRWNSAGEVELTHGRSETYEFQVSGTKSRDMSVSVSYMGDTVRISGVTVHNIVEGVMRNSPMVTKRAMLEHLKHLIEEEERKSSERGAEEGGGGGLSLGP